MSASRLLGVALVLTLAALGCTKPSSLPKTYPVTGSVVYKGGQPVAGAGIQFTSVSDSSFSVSGDVAADGKFTLATVKGREKTSGAPEGEYKVTVHPPIPADRATRRPNVGPIELPKTYKVEAKENHFAIEVEPPPRS
jgi:hypothetical protein